MLCVGSALTPAGLDLPITSTSTAARMLTIAADHVGRLYLSNLLLLLGLGVLAVSFGSMATLVRSRGAALATVAAVIGGFGCFCGALGNVLPGFNLAGVVSANVRRTSAEAFLVTTFTSSVGRFIFVGYLLGMLLGAVLMAVALWRSGRIPRWLPLLFVLGLGIATFAPAGPRAIPVQLPFLVAMVLLGRNAWHAAARTPGVRAPAGTPAAQRFG
jgi:hypothetical protein